MAKLIYSRDSRADLREIAQFTREQWGDAQADRYLDQLHACCEQVARTPGMGRAIESTGYRRLEQGAHAVFYQVTDAGDVHVVRILHARMLPERHLVDDDKSSD